MVSATEQNDKVEHATYMQKYLPIPGLLINTAIVSTLLGAKSSHWASSESLANLVTSHRASVGIVVQIISHILGIIEIYAICESSGICISLQSYLR